MDNGNEAHGGEEYLWNPEIVNESILPILLTWLDPTTASHLGPVYDQSVQKLEEDPLIYKRRVENLFNNGVPLGSDDPFDKKYYRVDWFHAYNGLKRWRDPGIFLREADPEYVRLALELGADPVGRYAPLDHLAADGYTASLQVLLTDPRVDPSIRNNSATRLAAYRYHLETVDLLLRDPRVRKTLDHIQIERCAMCGSVEAVLLLLDRGINPATLGEKSIGIITGTRKLRKRELELSRDAREKQRADVLRILIKDGRIEKNAAYQSILDFLAYADTYDQRQAVIALLIAPTTTIETVENILNSGVVIPSDPRAIQSIFLTRNEDVQLAILESKRIPLARYNNLILCCAGYADNYRVGLWLLEKKPVITAFGKGERTYPREVIQFIRQIISSSSSEKLAEVLKPGSDAIAFKRAIFSGGEQDPQKQRREPMDSRIVNQIAQTGTVASVTEMLADPNLVLPTDPGSLEKMFGTQRQEIQDLVVQSGKIPDLSIHGNLILRVAGTFPNIQTMAALLKDQRVLQLIRNNPTGYEYLQPYLAEAAVVAGVEL